MANRLVVEQHDDGAYLVAVDGHNNGKMVSDKAWMLIAILDAMKCLEGTCSCSQTEPS